MLQAPYYYDLINKIEGSYFPSQVRPCNNLTYDYWLRSLVQKLQSVIEFKNLPASWMGAPKDFLYLCFFMRGYVAGWNDKQFGPTFQPCGLTGQNLYYQPVIATISNPAFKDGKTLEIGKDCEIIKLTPDYLGVWDLISLYAERLSTLDSAIQMSIINNKIPFVMGAKSKGMAQMIKKIFDKVNRGEPLVIYDDVFTEGNSKQLKTSDNPFSVFDREHLKNSYITTDQLKDAQTILNQFYNEVGIPTVPYQKMERMVNEEAQSQKIASSSRLAVWMDCLTDGFDKFNAMCGTNIRVVKRFDTEEGESDEFSENNDTGL